MSHWFKYALTAAALTITSLLFAQNEVLLIKGNLKDEATLKKLDGVQVIVYQNGQQFDVYDAGTSGRFQFELPLGYTYDIKFSRTDYVYKILRMDTRNIPPEDRAGGFQLDLDVKLFPMIEGFNTDIMKEPIGKASFSSQENMILFDFDYTERMQEKIEAERKRLADLAKDGEKLKKEYDKLMLEGEQKMIEKKYQEAMAKFDGALKIFPKDEPAKKKYDEAKAAYDAEQLAKKADAEYNKLLADGEANIKAKKYLEAKKNFQDASKLKPSEKYPKEKLYEIDQLLEQQELLAQYEAIVAEADAKFNSKDYALAIEKYREASKVMPAQTYPKDQIIKAQAALDALLADEAKKKQLEQRYNDMMALGERNLKDKNYEVARGNFVEASALKPEEQLPKDKISDIDKLLADLKARQDQDSAVAAANAEKERIDREYNQHIEAGNKFYQDSKETDKAKLESALVEYRAASALKSSEKYPRAQITSIEGILARLSAENDSKALADAKAKEEERLRQEELMRKQKEDQERLAEEQRRKRMEEDEARRKAEAEEAARLAADRNRGTFARADRSEEEALDAYYREAREIEEDAKYQRLKEKQEAYAALERNQANGSSERLKEKQDNIEAQKEELSRINRTGDSWNARSAAETQRAKEQDDKNKQEYANRSATRQKEAQSKAEAQKEQQSNLSQNDRNRQAMVQKTLIEQETYKESEEAYRSKGETQRTRNEAAVTREKETATTMAKDGEQVRQENVNAAMQKKEDSEEHARDLQSAANVRLDNAHQEQEQQKEQAQRIGEGKESLTEDNIMKVNDMKQSSDMLALEKETEAAEKRHETRRDLYELNPGREKSDDEYLPVPGTEDLPEGVTETTKEYTRPSRKVIERTVKRGNKVDTYRKVVSKTGIYYFKNDQSITETQWIQETLKVGE